MTEQNEEGLVGKEYRQAKLEGRQPRCPYCQAPLEVGQTRSEDVVWRWDDEEKVYNFLGMSCDADKPYCLACHSADWDFIDGDWVD